MERTGVLKNGKTVAVKRLTISQTRRVLTNFQSEVKLISNVHHRNLIRSPWVLQQRPGATARLRIHGEE
ncbi:G-type lectin S-receptor-like serine/threonine-protein kinase [Acorus calamus]|uniref:G-type lectin S-receptor-like serine/threonine-protein kinase n=1 Tax=Acorus calamus TaxID=4465 RepID=A0AAV9DPR7_ACOCL|nr:G-type lectin S-receptor-like serine/threonine-protein kinase [Acorus calamus]